MAATASVTQPGDAALNAVVGNFRWAASSVTFSFPTLVAQYETPYGGANETSNNFGALMPAQQDAARIAFASFGAVSGLSFTEYSGTLPVLGDYVGNATIRVALSDAPSTAWAYLPSTTHRGGDVWLNNSSGSYASPSYGNYAYATFMHEIGHSLGLDHAHESGMPSSVDSLEFTIMTYRSYVGGPTTGGYTNETWGYPTTLMMYDIAAIQYMYGPDWATNAGNTTYQWNPSNGQMSTNGVVTIAPGGNRIFMTIWDGGGTDTYDFSNYSNALLVDLRPGQWSTTSSAQLARLHWNGSQIARGNIANALQYQGSTASLIENANGGSAGDEIVGNEANNLLRGNGGNDTIYGQGGTDTAAFTGTFAQYSFVEISGGYVIIDSIGGRDGTDIVYGIELVQFSDGTVAATDLITPIAFAAPAAVLSQFGANQGWTSDDTNPRMLADVNGDGRVDIIGFATNGAYVSLSTGSGFSAPILGVGDFATSQGWTSNNSLPRRMGDVNGDGRDDIVAFGANGVFVALGQANGTFATPIAALAGFSTSLGWTSNDSFTRLVGDVNGDGRADIVGFGNAGAHVALGQANGTFGSVYVALNGFNPANGWTSQDQFPRILGDVNGDGRDDIVGFGYPGVLVSLGQANGTFASPYVALAGFNPANGWTSFNSYPRLLADVTGDGRDDLIGFGNSILVSEALGNGMFGQPRVVDDDFVPATGWTSQDAFPRWLGDVNNDNLADIVGFGMAGVLLSVFDV